MRGSAESGQDFRDVGHWLPNDALDHIVLTYGYVENLENVRVDVWGGRREEGRFKVLQAPRVGCGFG